MGIPSGALNLLAFPQRWDADTGTLTLRFLCLPQRGPLTPLAPGLPTFAAADLRFEARLIGSLDHVPRTADSVGVGPLQLDEPPSRKAELFDALAELIEISPAVPAPGPPPRYRKAATAGYRSLVGDRLLSDHIVDVHAYECALHAAHAGQPEVPDPLPTGLRWGQVIALAMRQPRLAAALGLVGEADVVPGDGFFTGGGWLSVGLHPTSAGAGVAGLAVSYAARIPPLHGSRHLYAAVVFPVDHPNLTLDDDAYRDAQHYDTGHARLVHAVQTEPGEGDGDAIRLAWDDEQVAEWLNRQFAAANAVPMGTAGYRVDVREAGAARWTSLQRIRSMADLAVGAVDLGPFEGEGMVEVVPVRIAPDRPGEFWMPPYFTTWRGTSLVLTDRDLARLHQREDIGIESGLAVRLDRERTFEPVGDADVRLLYGHDYEFRVRLADLTCGGPAVGTSLPAADPSDDTHHVAAIRFRRRTPPGPVEVRHSPTRAAPRLEVAKPWLGHPEILYTGSDVTFATLETAFLADLAADRPRGLGRPDPDVTTLRIAVEVRALAGDTPDWQPLYEADRTFAEETLTLDVDLQDRATLAGFPNQPGAQVLPLPTARDVRLVLTPIGRDGDYFASETARVGTPVTVELHAHATAETALLADDPELDSFFFRLPPSDGSVPRPAERLATELGLDHHDLTVAGRAGRRTVIGCSASLRHTLTPERSAITFSADADVTQQWVHVLRFRLDRDWTWRGLGDDGIAVYRRIRQGGGAMSEPEFLGAIRLPRVLPPRATTGLAGGARAAARQVTDVVFFDAHDPKPDPTGQPTEYPTEQRVRYELVPAYETGQVGDRIESPTIELPVTTPPAQVPRLVSAGIAFTPVGPDDDYTTARRSSLWLEFAAPPRDPGDGYFVRPLVSAPDPLLTDVAVPETVPEPALPVDPEWMRRIAVDQPHDDNGALAMQLLRRRADQGEVYLIPLPNGVDPSSPDLFGMYTYEIRTGHADTRWCTANGRFGPPLRVAGVQHPPPPITCQATRTTDSVRVRAPFATPTLHGRHVRPAEPRTSLWALLYARVQQADGAAWRHLLLDRAQMRPPRPFPGVPSRPQPATLQGEGRFALDAVHHRLRLAGLPADTALSTVVVEVHTERGSVDPLGDDLGRARLLRASPMASVPAAC